MKEPKLTNKRLAIGSYELRYGIRGDYLVAKMWFNDLTNAWQVEAEHESAQAVNATAHKRMASCKEAFGVWAANRWGTDPTSPPPAPPAAPTPPPPPMPPVALPPAPPPPPAKPVDISAQFEADPLSPEMRYASDDPDVRKRKLYTPLGLIIEIREWYTRNEARVMAINAKLALNAAPGWNPFDSVISEIDNTLTALNLTTKKEPPNDTPPPSTSEETSSTSPPKIPSLPKVPAKGLRAIPLDIDDGDIPF